MNPIPASMSISEVAERTGLNASAIRYYEAAGLVPAPGRRSGRRVYDADAVAAIRFIARSRKAGLSIPDIRGLVGLVRGIDPGSSECQSTRALAQAKLSELDEQIAQAQALRTQLARALATDCEYEAHCPVP